MSFGLDVALSTNHRDVANRRDVALQQRSTSRRDVELELNLTSRHDVENRRDIELDLTNCEKNCKI